MTYFWVALVVAVFANIMSNVALKIGVHSVDMKGDKHTFLSIIENPWLWGGVILAGVLLVSYVYALKGIALSVAYPSVTALSIVGISIISHWFLGERFGLGKGVGLLLVAAGVYLLCQNPDG